MQNTWQLVSTPERLIFFPFYTSHYLRLQPPSYSLMDQSKRSELFKANIFLFWFPENMQLRKVGGEIAIQNQETPSLSPLFPHMEVASTAVGRAIVRSFLGARPLPVSGDLSWPMLTRGLDPGSSGAKAHSECVVTSDDDKTLLVGPGNTLAEINA